MPFNSDIIVMCVLLIIILHKHEMFDFEGRETQMEEQTDYQQEFLQQRQQFPFNNIGSNFVQDQAQVE